MKKRLLLAGIILAAHQNNAFAAGDDIVDLTQDSDGLGARAASASPLGDDGKKPVSDEDYALLVAAGIESKGGISGRARRGALRDQRKVEVFPRNRGQKRAREGVQSETDPKAARVVLGENNTTNKANKPSKPRIRYVSEIFAARLLLALRGE